MRLSAADVRARFSPDVDRAGADAQPTPPDPGGARTGIALAAVVAAVMGAAWGAPIMAQMIGEADFPFHLTSAEQFASNTRITMPHFLLQVLLGGLISTGWFPTVQQAGLVLFTALYAATAALICWYIGRGTAGMTTLGASVVIAAAVLLAGPVLPSGEPSLYLIGYFPPNAFHNPTMLLAKPLLIFVLAAAVAAITRTGRPNGHELALIALPVVLLGAAKPNYLGCVVPVVLAMAAWNRATKRAVSWTRVASICVPAVLMLGASYALYRSQPLGSEGGVIVAPLRVLALYVPVDPRSIAGHVSASVAFPLAVLALWPRAAWNTTEIRFAWATTLVAFLISFLLAEEGPSLDHGNFLWTGQMAVFVLFVVSAMFVNHQLSPAARSGWTAARALLTAGVLVLHIESGVRHVTTRVESLQWLVFWM